MEELLDKAPRLKPGSRVLELGCWPGSWLQVLRDRVGPEGCVVGVDLQAIEPLEGVQFLQLDFTEPESLAAITQALGGPVQLVLSDAAPKLSGIPDVDRAQLAELYEGALRIAQALLVPSGGFIAKGFPGPESAAFRKQLQGHFPQLREIHPEGSRSTSREFYWVAGPVARRRSDRRRRRPKR